MVINGLKSSGYFFKFELVLRDWIRSLFGAVIKNLNRLLSSRREKQNGNKKEQKPASFNFCNGSAMNLVTCRFYTVAGVTILYYLMFCYLRMNNLL